MMLRATRVHRRAFSSLSSFGKTLQEKESCIIKIPATSANMGPGFDSFGMALDLHNLFTIKRADKFSLTALGEGADSLCTDESNLVVQACKQSFESVGLAMPPLEFTCENHIPNTRGLGSSSSALVGGLSAALVLAGYDLNSPQTKRHLLQMASDLEGHPDNVAPAIYGGFQVAINTGEQWITQRVNVPQGIQTVLYIPSFEMKTSEARGVLPTNLTQAEAVFNISRAAMLVNCFATGQLEALRYACDDKLHQPARSSFFPLGDIIQAAHNAGAHGAWLSGAGSTVMAICGGHGADPDADTLSTALAMEVAAAMEKAGKQAGLTGRTHITVPSADGVTEVAAETTPQQ